MSLQQMFDTWGPLLALREDMMRVLGTPSNSMTIVLPSLVLPGLTKAYGVKVAHSPDVLHPMLAIDPERGAS